MADLIFNVALGRVAELYNRVDSNDPANSVLVVMVINTSALDATLRDYDTVAAVTGDVNTAEVTNTNYARKTLTDADIVAFAPDDTNNRVDLDIPDQTWSAVAAGDSWTDVLICYDSDSTVGTDANIVPMTLHDFSISPDGSDVTMQISASGFYRASE